ncbi:MAG: class I SAM-dependent methyltransferase [Bacteroidales bacterium]|nr:class I SAM-dependent methyltransferase [Bacteroidales bacterium]
MEISVYECLNAFRKPLLDSIIGSLNIHHGSIGLDAGCGTGFITRMLAEQTGAEGSVTGLDLSRDFINYSRENNQGNNITFVEGDVNDLHFEDNSFDWIWSMDTVWPGPKKYGCPAENPYSIFKEFNRILKSGGRVYISYWSSQKLLPGYPLLEARLNTTSSASAPFIEGMDPGNHFMNGKRWLQASGFNDVSANTFTGDINAPLSENDHKALNILIQMLWGSAESELSSGDIEDFKNLYNPESEDHFLKNQYYYGFYTYTLIMGYK